MVDESHTVEMRIGKRPVAVVLSFCVRYFPDERNTFCVEMDFDELPVQNIQLRFTASALGVRKFWRRLPSFVILGSFCFQQFEIHMTWLTVYVNVYFGCALIGYFLTARSA